VLLDVAASGGRGESLTFFVLCVGAGKTSMSGDVIPVRGDLITDSSNTVWTDR
jgi:hypothetical protein